MEDANVLIEFMSALDTAEIAGATIIGGLTSAITIFIATIISRNKRLKNSVSKSDLEKGIKDAKDYTNEQMKVHEDKQTLEFSLVETKINETHDMVTRLLDIQLNK